MQLKLVSVGTRPPAWTVAAFAEYRKRMPREMSVELVEVDAPKNVRDRRRLLAAQGERCLQKVSAGDWVVALDEHGEQLSSMALADRMDRWRMNGKDVTFVVGGADGLADTVRSRANETVSLSKLTFPHYMVRVILAEALYRAWTIGTGHPYHRE